MFKLLKIELRRYLYPMLLMYLIFAFYLMVSHTRFSLDSLITDIGIGLITLVLLIFQIKDLLFEYPMMYRQTTHSPRMIFYSRVLVVFLPGLVWFLLALLMINIKAGMLYMDNPILYIVSEHSKIRYVLFGKRFIEFFVPLHTIINHFLYVIIVMFTAISIKQTLDFSKTEQRYTKTMYLIVRVILLHVIYRFVLLGLILLFRSVDLNYFRYYLVLGSVWSPFYVNFLFFPAWIIYGFDLRRLDYLVYQRMIPLEHVYIPRIMDIYERVERNR
jgi:hypothetical protein